MRDCLPTPGDGALPLPAGLDASLLDFLPRTVEELSAAVVPPGHPQLATPTRDPRVSEWVERGVGRQCGLHLRHRFAPRLSPAGSGSSFLCLLLYPPARPACQGVLDFKGGETAALERLHYYLWGSDLVATYFDTRNGMLGGWVRWKSGAYREGDWQRETARCRPGWQCRQCAVVCAPLRSAPPRLTPPCPYPLPHCPQPPTAPFRWRLLDQVCALAGARVPVAAGGVPRAQAVRAAAHRQQEHLLGAVRAVGARLLALLRAQAGQQGLFGGRRQRPGEA